MDPVSVSQLQAAASQMQNGQLHAARTQLNALRLKYPNHADIEHLLAMAAKAEGKLEQAEAHFLASLKASPAQPVVQSNLGNLYQTSENWEKAAAAYRSAVKLDPKFVNGWHNLAIVLCRSGKFQEAEKAARTVGKLVGQTHQAVSLSAYVQVQAGQPEQAKAIYKAALQQSPASAPLWLSFAGILRADGEFEEAAKAYERAKALGSATVDLYLNLAEAYYELHQTEKALGCYQEALQVFDGEPQIHYAYARFLWESKPAEDHLAPLKQAIPKQANNIGLWGSYFDLLSHEGRYQDILKGVGEAYRVGIHAPRLTLAEAVALSSVGEDAKANALFEKLLKDDPKGIPPKYCYVEHLLKSGDAVKAEQLCAEILEEDPKEQKAWTYRGTAWQLLGDPRAGWLFDFEAMVHTIEVEAPDGYDSQASFFEAVCKELEILHQMQAHPIDQTLRGGTQTNGFLFRLKNPVLRQLQEQLRIAVERTVATFPDEPDHPFWGRKAEGIDFSGAWSVRLRSQGFHTNHFHPEGWISSALYVSLPTEVETGAGPDGFLQFGAPVTEMGLDLKPSRLIKPKVGSLALFPSYMWHGTVPFTSEEPRITVAFDVIPA